MENNKDDITAYSIYHVQANKRKKVNPLDELYPKLPNKKYQIILINRNIICV